MLSQDLYSVMSNIASSFDALLETQENQTSDNVNALCDSIDKLCKTVTDGKSVNGAETVLGLIAGALAGETDKIEKGADMLTKSINNVSASLNEIGKTSSNIANSTKSVSDSMQYLSSGIESIGLRTMMSAYIAKVSFPAIYAFTNNAINLFTEIADKEKDLKSAEHGMSLLSSSIEYMTKTVGAAAIGGAAAIIGIAALVPLSIFITGVSAVFLLATKLFDKNADEKSSKAISAMAHSITDLAWAAASSTIAAPFFVLGTVALAPMSLFILGVAGVNLLVNKLFDPKKNANYDAIHSMAKGILYMSLAAGAAILAAPVALLAIPCVLVLGLFTAAVGALVVKPINSLVNSKGFKDFSKGIAAMTLGILTLGLAATATVLLAPVMLLGSVAMLATGLFVKVSGKVFNEAAKSTKNYLKGTLGLVVMSAGILATSYLLVQAVKTGKDLLTWDTLGVLGVITAVTYGGTKLMQASGKALGSVIKGAVAVMLVAGTVFGAAYLFNKAVTECKGLIDDPASTIEGLVALIGSVTVMGAAIAAAGLALPFIAPGAAAVALVSGTVFMAAKAISSASEAWEKSQTSGSFEIDSDGGTPFSKTIKGVVSSMIDAVKDIDDIDKLGDAIEAIMPISDFVQKLAVGVSEFSKIAMMKGTIADSTGKKMPFNLTKVGEGIGAVCGSVITGISDAMTKFNFGEDNMVEISSGGFLGFGQKKTLVPKQISAIQHLMPLANFVSGLASGVSEFSKLATMKGDITTYDENGKAFTRPFNLQDVGVGIKSVMTSLMEGISMGMDAFGKDMVEISTGGFLGIGGDKMKVPAKLANLQYIMPLASFISSCAEFISSTGKDENGNAINVDSRAISDIFSGIINAFNIEDVDDILEDAGDGLKYIIEPLEDFCDINWKNIPDQNGIKSLSDLINNLSVIDTSKINNISEGASAVKSLADALSSDTSINGDNVGAVSDGVSKAVSAINDLDTKKANALSEVYNSMAKAASKKSNALKEVVKAIKESTEALISAVDKVDNNKYITPSTNNTSNNNNQYINNQTSSPEYQKNIADIQQQLSAIKQKVTVDLLINGQSGDQWIIRRR